MATLTPLAPDADGTITGVTDQAGGTTNLYVVVTDGLDSTYVHPGIDLPGEILFRLSDVDADFASMDTLAGSFRCRLNGTVTDDTTTLFAQVFDGNATTTALTNEVTVATEVTAGSTFNVKTPAFTISGTPTKAQWNNAYLRLRWTYTKNKASDGIEIQVSEAQVTGTYTAGATTHDLTGVADLAHGHTLDAAPITQQHDLTVADLAHPSTIDGGLTVSVVTPDPDADLLLLTSGGTDNLLLASGDHLYLASTTASSSLTVSDLAHSHTLDAVSLTQQHNLAAPDLEHANTIDAVSVTQQHDLTVADLAHSHTVDSVTIDQLSTLTVADLAHSHTVDAVTLTQNHALTAADLGHSHTLDAVTLTQDHDLTVADLAHGHTIDSPAVSTAGSVSLTVNDLAHGHTVDSVTVTQDHDLAVSDLNHGHTVDAVSVTQQHDLTANDLSHGHTIDEPAVATGGSVGLTVADLSHSHTVDAVSVTQDHDLTVGDLAHAHTVDSVTVTQTHVLTANGLEHASTVDAVALTQIHALAVAGLAHTHTIDDVLFDSGRLLQIAAAALAARWRASDLTSDHDAEPLVAHWSATSLKGSP